jgi:hypothetical protein
VWRSKDYLKRFGVRATLGRLAHRMQYPVLGYTRYLCLILPAYARAVAPPLPGGFVRRKVDLAELEPLLAVPESSVRRKDLDRALVEGHRCIGIFEGDDLASFSLNAPAPTGLDATWRFQFPEGWAYHYMAVTLPRWRGKRLHAMQFPAIEECFSGPRFQGIVTLVSSENYGSRESFRRIGFRPVRSFAVVGRPSRQILVTGRAAGEFGLARHAPRE